MPNISKLQAMIQRMRTESLEETQKPPYFSDFVAAHPELTVKDCVCGREFSFAKIHCPQCGSAPAYSKNPIEAIMPDGTVVLTGVYKCRRCPRVYTEHDVFFNCKAPTLVVKQTKEEKRAQDKLIQLGVVDSPGELVKALIQKRQDEGKPLGSLEEVAKKFKEVEPKPGTPEWYEAHPEES